MSHHTRSFFFAILACVFVSTAAHADSGHPNVKGRIGQGARIHQGVVEGDLTRPEARALAHEQREIAELRHDMARDGHLDRTERRILRHERNEADRHIRTLRHNDAER